MASSVSAPEIAIFGAGPAGLFAAETAAQGGARVTVYDRMRLPGRKFLLAGRGGLNLTHAEPLEKFVGRYREGGAEIQRYILDFPPEQLRAWAHGLGQDTFIGSSDRVYPRVFKSSPLLRAWLSRLELLGVRFVGESCLRALSPDGATLHAHGEQHVVRADAYLVALGGGSWPELGSDGAWTSLFGADDVRPLLASNAGIRILWPDAIRAIAGKPLKLISVLAGGHRFKGEAVVTDYGLEGGAIYLANAEIRALLAAGQATIHLDFQPNLTADVVAERAIQRTGKRTFAPWLQRTLGLSPASSRIVTILQARDRSPAGITRAVKRMAIKVEGMAPIERAISSAGGVLWRALNPDLSLRRAPNIFVAGEMIDWDAPTGGYLLQACFASGRAAGLGALAYARARLSEP